MIQSRANRGVGCREVGQEVSCGFFAAYQSRAHRWLGTKASVRDSACVIQRSNAVVTGDQQDIGRSVGKQSNRNNARNHV